MRTKIEFEVSGDLAMYARPDGTRQSFMMPTPGAIRGMVKGVHHHNKVWTVPLRVGLLAPLKTIMVSQHMLENIQIKRNRRRGKIKRKIVTCLYLQDVDYRIEAEVTGPRDEVETLIQRLEEGAFCSPPYLGTRECMAETRQVTSKPLVDVSFIEPHLWLGNRGPVAPITCEHGIIKYPYDLTRKAIEDRYHECRSRKAL